MRTRILALFALCLLSFDLSYAVADETKKSFVLGRVSVYPDEEMSRLESLSIYLKQNLPNAENMHFEQVIVSSLEEMIELLKKGEVDLVSETPFAAMELQLATGAEILLRERKYGMKEYDSLLIANSNLDIKSLDDFKGQLLALEDPGSTSGFWLPVSVFVNAGIPVREVESTTAPIGKDEVGYIFAGDSENVTQWIASGIAAGGGVSEYDLNTPNRTPLIVRSKLRVVTRSQSVLRSLVLVPAGMPPELKESIKTLLSEMHDKNNGWETMRSYNRVRRFDPIDAEMSVKLKELEGLYKTVKAVIQ
ncbi:hypothetical protein GCM10017044_26600 [Kordiimonas sediminis]|uniref:Phosphate/phosphite/phosphonate ABC transporter substrate-binding protein n=1 Tax=Kordiimonas sediminis TaxID=1735581 RepID=A0A919AX45_9PROT|nr:phosphate/phosphite/phosphonate ABC transporter substrate-binding protein [Kordiimonas sediminis]GHF29962.1 hypothetical protein GCM10017044_26600 [Kordiimonas sediminis]